MTSLPASDRLGPVTPSNCEREPIHIPEAIQPDGVLLACEGPERRITHASANCATLLGIGLDSVLGRRLSEVTGAEATEAILLATESERYAPSNVLSLRPPGRDGPPCDVLAHEICGRVVVEMEPGCEGERGEDPLPQVQALVQALRRAGDLEQLCELAVREMKRLTGHDRCMVYRFDADGHGQVVAEAREADQEPYLHLRYPASDIPAQARRLYLQQRVRAIADVNYTPVPLLAAQAGEGRWT